MILIAFKIGPNNYFNSYCYLENKFMRKLEESILKLMKKEYLRNNKKYLGIITVYFKKLESSLQKNFSLFNQYYYST